MSNKNKEKQNKKFTPFSKKNIIYARIEAYVFSLILVVMVWFGRDVSAIAVLLTLAWTGYKLLQTFYIWMCKHEHLIDKQIEYRKIELDSSHLNMELSRLENTDITEGGMGI